MGVLSLHEPRRPTTVLRWHSPTAANTTRQPFTIDQRSRMLDAQVMDPEVAEVVLVDKPLTSTEPEPVQPHVAGVLVERCAAGKWMPYSRLWIRNWCRCISDQPKHTWITR